MAWGAKRKAMTWEWFQDECAVSQVAATCALMASEQKRKIMFVLPSANGYLIITCKGTPVPTVKKTKEASE